MNQKKTIWICLAVACLFVLLSSACVETAMRYHGNKVSAVDAIALSDQGPHRGSWSTFDMSMEYEYYQDGDTFKVAGEVLLGDHQRNIYPLLKNLSVYLFFLDADSSVIETVSLVNALNVKTDAVMSFDLSHQKPADSVGISFGYSGFACEYGKGPHLHHDGCLSFSQLPLSKE